MVHSVQIGDTRTIVQSPANADGFHGVTFDPKERKMYFSSRAAIYRANLDGTGIQRVFSSMKYDLISALDFDWITGNLYGVSTGGMVFVCTARVSGRRKCVTIFKGQGMLRGIALDPTTGLMYWTSDNEIVQSNMDGSGAKTLLEGLKEPVGIVVSTIGHGKGLVWMESAAEQFGMLQFGGNTSQVNQQFFPGFKPRGLIVAGERFMCFGSSSFMIVTSSRPGFETTAYNSTETINHMFTPSLEYDFSRQNDCEGKVLNCETICVLTPTGSQCLSQICLQLPSIKNN